MITIELRLSLNIMMVIECDEQIDDDNLDNIFKEVEYICKQIE